MMSMQPSPAMEWTFMGGGVLFTVAVVTTAEVWKNRRTKTPQTPAIRFMACSVFWPCPFGILIRQYLKLLHHRDKGIALKKPVGGAWLKASKDYGRDLFASSRVLQDLWSALNLNAREFLPIHVVCNALAKIMF
jgi:hypothetical protein